MIRYLGEEGITQSEELKEHGVLINEECAREEREETQGAVQDKDQQEEEVLCPGRENPRFSATAGCRGRKTD